MAALNWTVIVGGESYSGSTELIPGSNHIRIQAEPGVIQSVRASMPWSMDSAEKLFMNGFQTWTYCPEYGIKDRVHNLGRLPKSLINKHGLDRYGDYHFVEYSRKKGCTHGFSYCYFRRGEQFRLLASLDERPGYTIFRYDSGEQLLSIERDCAGVEHRGGELPMFDLYMGEGSEDAVFDGWFAAMDCRCRTKERMAGYSSWYNRYQNITEQTIMDDLAGCRTLLQKGDLFQVDDGWEPFVGDWMEPDGAKFPSGMKAVADAIHESGFAAGLWLAPFVCESKSEIYKNHPDWLLLEDGKPWSCGSNWSGFYSLDIDNPQVLEYLRNVFDKVLNEWGFDLVKLDFLYGAAPFGNSREARGGRMIRAMELLREWCGDKLILGCGVPVMPAFGLVDYCRISCDVGLDWDATPLMRLTHRERVSTRQAIGNTIFRRQLNGRAYGSDPDVFFLRENNIKLTEAEKDKLIAVNSLFSQILLTSDNPGDYSDRAREKYRALLAMRDATEIRVDADNGISVSYRLNGEQHSFTI